MELNTTSRDESKGHEVELDVTKQQEHFQDAVIVIFNLDLATDLKAKYKEICQIAACCNGQKFNVYIMPDSHFISKSATSIHGIKIEPNGYERYALVQNGNEVPALSPREGLTKFLDFLSDQTSQTRKVLLAAHNCSAFHRHILVRLMKQCNLLDYFQAIVLGTVDTLQVFKITLNSQSANSVQEKKKFDLETLAEEYIPGIIEGRRDATVTVNILALLIAAIGCTDAMMKQHAKDLDVFLRSIDLEEDLEGVVTSNMIVKIAEAGISIDVLKNEYRASGGEGVSRILQEKVNGKVRVTKKKEIIENINAKLSKLLDRENGNAN